jgi:hypothetical protein
MNATVTRPAILQKVHAVRALMINVATGLRRIEEAEAEYTALRSEIAVGLHLLGISDPNGFHSLWDWFNYWKVHNLATYQSRRTYMTSLFKPVIEALEAAPIEAPQKANTKATQIFSIRYGYDNTDAELEITIREELPLPVRDTVISIMTQLGVTDDALFNIASRIGNKSWMPSVSRQSGVPARLQLKRLVSEWDWYLVYDFVEEFYAGMENWETLGDSPRPEEVFADKINGYFRHAGVGWQLQDGKITSRGSEAFEVAVHRALPALEDGNHQTARKEIHEALADLSRRPHADLTGAIHHAMGALECIARTATGDSTRTLGQIVPRHPNLIPKPLDGAIEKAWAYASERARHIREGNDPTRDEAELIVGIAATVATYLSKKKVT